MDRFPEQGPQSSRAEPHARGDGPPRQGTDPPSTRRAPRTWGWTAASGNRSAEHAPSPTYVGTDRPARRHRKRATPEPHARGDEVFLRLYAQSSRGVRLLVSADFCDSSENVRGRPYGSASETYIAPRRLAMSMDAPHGHGGSPESLDMGLWGKSEGLPPDVRYPLICHLLDVGAVAEVLWRDHVATGVRQTIADGLETTVEHAGRLIPYWASLHDVGKLNHGFQAQDVAAPIHRYPGSELRRSHGQVVGEWLQYVLPEHGYAAEGRGAPAPIVAQLLGGHHGSFHRHADSVSATPLRSLGYGDDAWEEQRRLHLAELTELFGSPTPPARFDGSVAALVC